MKANETVENPLPMPPQRNENRNGRFKLYPIGDDFGLHYSRENRIVAAGEKAKGKTTLYFLYFRPDPLFLLYF